MPIYVFHRQVSASTDVPELATPLYELLLAVSTAAEVQAALDEHAKADPDPDHYLILDVVKPFTVLAKSVEVDPIFKV